MQSDCRVRIKSIITTSILFQTYRLSLLERGRSGRRSEMRSLIAVHVQRGTGGRKFLPPLGGVKRSSDLIFRIRGSEHIAWPLHLLQQPRRRLINSSLDELVQQIRHQFPLPPFLGLGMKSLG
uniref:Uncharacterized protein n=1 Tax=Cannabis sativa TaxID=3483 RepID=A0A803Q843_CANSA